MNAKRHQMHFLKKALLCFWIFQSFTPHYIKPFSSYQGGGGGIHITLFFVTYFDTNHQIFTLITKTIIVWIMIIKHFFILHRGIFYSSHSREDFHFTFYPPGFKCVCAPHLKLNCIVIQWGGLSYTSVTYRTSNKQTPWDLWCVFH